jgi:hypothetical protein
VQFSPSFLSLRSKHFSHHRVLRYPHTSDTILIRSWYSSSSNNDNNNDNNKIRGLSQQANYTDRATAACLRS